VLSLCKREREEENGVGTQPTPLETDRCKRQATRIHNLELPLFHLKHYLTNECRRDKQYLQLQLYNRRL